MKNSSLYWRIGAGTVFLVLLIGCTALLTFAEEPEEEKPTKAVITGKVLNFQKEPLQGAHVSLLVEKTLIFAETDGEGVFAFGEILLSEEKTTGTITVEYPGYRRWEQVIDLESGTELHILVNLTPAPDFLTLLLFAPALLGLIAWLALHTGFCRWGEIVVLIILTAYLLTLFLWVAVSEEWIIVKSLKEVLLYFILTMVPAVSYWGKRVLEKRKDKNETLNDRTPNTIELPSGTTLGRQAAWFIGTSAALWVFTAGGLFYAYLNEGIYTVALFHPALGVPFIVPLFALLGVVVYVAASIRDHVEDGVNTAAYRKPIVAAGERILIAPYVAVIADLILFHPFAQAAQTLGQNVGTLSLEAFLAFFTGLFVKVVLNRLNQLATHFLTEEARSKKEKQELKDEFVDILGMDRNLAQRLRNCGITSIIDLKNLSDEELKEKAKIMEIVSVDQLREWRRMACQYLKEMEAFREIFGLNEDQIARLNSNRIISLQQISDASISSMCQFFDIATTEKAIQIRSKAEAFLKLSERLDSDLIQKQKLEGQEVKSFVEIPGNSPEENKQLDNLVGILDEKLSDGKEVRELLQDVEVEAVYQYSSTKC